MESEPSPPAEAAPAEAAPAEAALVEQRAARIGSPVEPGRDRRSLVRTILRRSAVALAALLAAPLAVIAALRWIDPPTTAFMLRDALVNRRAVDQRWTDLDRIAPSMALAVVAAEDQLFPVHHGFDVESIQDAWEHLPRGGDAGTTTRDRRAAGRRERVRGASTLTQQVAKNLFLWPGRSFVRKGIEAWLTAAIELLWPKRRIIEVYLNIAEMGPGLYGVGAAAAVHFGKTPDRLTRREAALIAAALPNPDRRHPGRPSAWLSERASWIERQIEQLGGAAYLGGILDPRPAPPP